MQLSAWGRWPRLGKARPGIRFNEHIEGEGPTIFAHALQDGTRRHRVEAARLALPLRKIHGLAQVQEPGGPGGEARGGGRLGQKRTEMTTTRTHFTFRVDTWTPNG